MRDTVAVRDARVVREVCAYLVIAYGLAVVVASGIPHARINLLLSVAIPIVTVTILTFTLTPRGARRQLWGTFGLRHAGLRMWPAAVLVPVLLCFAATGAAVLSGAGRLRELSDPGLGWFGDLAVTVILGTVLILGEEVGWRGFLLPRLQQLTTARRGAVATGLAHGCFHLPLIVLATTYDTEVPTWIAAPVAVIVITAGGVFYAWIHDSAATVWAAAVAHNAVNVAFDLGAAAVIAAPGRNPAYIAGETGYATLVVCLVLAVVLLRWGSVWQRPTADRHQTDDTVVDATGASGEREHQDDGHSTASSVASTRRGGQSATESDDVEADPQSGVIRARQ